MIKYECNSCGNKYSKSNLSCPKCNSVSRNSKTNKESNFFREFGESIFAIGIIGIILIFGIITAMLVGLLYLYTLGGI